ncbi:MAG: hypothetical protein NC904_08780 [Candidatus Omnitrophica bacterium]|nr:hypothetical protein [Candidatus Omnitrophota bacterium]
MATMKSKKGNPFEYDTMYNFIDERYDIIRPDTNIKGIDIIIYDKDNLKYLLIECKNRNLSWNELKNIYDDNMSNVIKFTSSNGIKKYDYYIIFKPKRTEVLVFYCIDKIQRYLSTFRNTFKKEFIKRPKGFSVNKIFINKIKE